MKTREKGSSRTYVNTLNMHLAVPETRDFIEYFPRLFILNRSSNGVVGAREVALGFEFNVGD